MRRLGAAVVVAVSLTLLAAVPAQATSAGSNGRIAYWYGGVDHSRSGIYTIRSDGTGPRRLTSALDSEPAWSPDGRRIAFVRGLEIWMMGGQGRHPHQVTTSPSWNVEPAFSADGGTIAFVSNRTGDWNVFELNARRPYGHARQITHTTGPNSGAEYPSFAPDGSLYWIERSDGDLGTTFTVMHAAADGTAPTFVLDCFSCWGLDVSPNGGSLLYSLSSEPNGVDCGQLGRYNLFTAYLKVFPDCVEGQGPSDASYSPDGRRLVSHWFGASGRSLVITDRNGRHRHRLPHTSTAAGPDWQPIP